MPTITDRVLTISHDHVKKTATVTARCDVNFNAGEVALMNTAPNANWYKLKCELWGADSGFNGADDYLYTLGAVKYFPGSLPAPTPLPGGGRKYNNREFVVTLGEGVLDEDNGTDEIYAKFIVTPLVFGLPATGKSNEVAHSF